jgi:hypothetical protein
MKMQWLATVSVAAVSFSAFTVESAQLPALAATATATSVQGAVISHTLAAPGMGSNLAADVSASGLFNLQQNTGANAILESGNTLALILDCSCAYVEALRVEAKAAQTALILGDITMRTPYGIDARSADRAISGMLGSSALRGASNSVSNFHGGNGLFNISQNTGANSILQATNTVAEIGKNTGGQGATSSMP